MVACYVYCYGSSVACYGSLLGKYHIENITFELNIIVDGNIIKYRAKLLILSIEFKYHIKL